jgi:predicted ATPase/DNA-binding SARP family transcriptional activator
VPRGKTEFRILGSLEIGDDGGSLPLRGGKHRTLLAVLLLHANETLSADTIIDRLWGERPPERAANALQVYVSQLRKLLPPDTLVTQLPGYALRIDPEQLDLSRFERLAGEGRAALDEGDPQRAAKRLREALELWRGQPLADVAFEPFAQGEVVRLEELRLATLEDRIDADLGLGRHATLVGELESLVQQHPARERLRAQLMLALYRSGRQAEALEEYRNARKALVEELGIEPGPTLQALEKAILVQDPSLDSAPAARSPGLDQLPVPPTPLVGREQELEAALELVRRDDVRLVTFTGPGGIGKTRLALEVARKLASEFGDGARFVALAPISDPLLVAPTIAEALGLPSEGLEGELAGRELLLLLDSFEQVLAAAPVLTSLLGASPGLMILVASRAVLRLSGEHEFQVPALAPEASATLFVQRAEAVKQDFDLGPEEGGAVAEICARLDGLPLAIELAAARSKLLSPGAMLGRLGSRLELLTGGARDAPARQQTLRTTIDWSYDLLDEPEQRLFARLAVFVGGCTLESAEAVCGDLGSSVLDGLASLVDKSLLRESSRREGRFIMLDTVHEYALERLATGGEQEELARRHMLHFLELAEQSAEQLTGANQAPWMRRLTSEHDNLRAAIAFTLEHGEGELGLRFGMTVWRFWEFQGHFAERGRTLEALLAEPSAAKPSLERARVLNGAGVLAAERGELEAARGFFEESRRLAQQLGDENRAASALMNLGNLALFQGDLERARSLYEESTPVFRRTGDHERLAVALEDLGLVAHLQGDLERAEASLRESIETARTSSNIHSVSSASRELARVRLVQGANAEAAQLLAESLALVRAAEEPPALADCLESFAGLAVAGGAAGDAAVLFGAAQALRDSVASRRQPDQRPWYDHHVGQTRAKLGEEQFDTSFGRGRALPVEEAVELALSVGVP